MRRPLFALLILAALPALAGPPWVRRQTIPLVLALDGAEGARWSTELVLTNSGTVPAHLHLAYDAVTGGGTGEVDDVLPPLAQRFEPDAIAYLRRLGLDLPSDSPHSGTLRARFEGLADPNVVSMSARVTTPSGPGSAAVQIPGDLAASDAAQFSLSTIRTALLVGLREDARLRTNLALLHAGNPGDGDLVLRVTVHAGDPDRSTVSFDVTLAPREFRQIEHVLALAGADQGYVEIQPLGSGFAPFLCYATIIDRETNAPTLSRTTFLVEEAVDSPAWRTELVALNPSNAPVPLRLSWQLPGGELAFELTLRPQEQSIIDLGQELRARGFALPETARGALRSNQGLPLAVRVVERNTGYATAIGGPRDGFWAEAHLFGLVEDGSRRSSVILVNPDERDSGDAVDLNVDTWDGDRGVLVARRTVHLPAKTSVLFPSFLASEAPGTRQGWVTVQRLAGNNPYRALSIINDGGRPGEGTGHGILVEGEESCPPSPPPSQRVLLSFTGGTFDPESGCDLPASTEASWLSRTAWSGPSGLAAAPNPSLYERRAEVFASNSEIDVLQHADAVSPYDGVFLGLTDQDLPIEITVERGDIVHVRFTWTATSPPASPCPTGGEIDQALPHGLAVEPGWPFQAHLVSGEMSTQGVLVGSAVFVRCTEAGGRIPVFFATRFTARRQ